MRCIYCKAENPPNAAKCGKCGKAVPSSEATFVGDEPAKQPNPASKPELLNGAKAASKGEDPQGAFVATSTPATPEGWSISNTRAPALPQGEFAPGTVLGDRYEIIALLGQGGMGAVYKARDTELDRLVALKIIRPELTTNPEILKRFKQELILARQVTHRNVIRIFDLGQADGFKFITMEYLEGQDLRVVLREKGKLTPEAAARVILQICRALEAAHGEGVIHRDLKPQNIMLDANGRAYVMDFGIARSAYLPGMTQTGALVGTPEYMSPEQAKGEKLGERSDLFSLGVILYELVIGQSPYYSDTPLATLWKRLQEKAKPLCEIDPAIPKAFSDIVEKALEIEPENRFASANEFAQHLESWLGISPSMIGSITDQALLPLPAQKPIWKYTAIGALALLLAFAGLGLPKKFFSGSAKKTAHEPVSVLVADFTNHTGDPIFDDTLEPMFNVALEGASFINAFNRGNAHKLAGQLPHPTEKLDEQPARLVAVSQGIGAVITGELSRRGEKYSISATALDAQTGNVIAKTEATAANKDEVLLTIPKLAAPIRKALGDTTSESAQLQAAGGAFTAASLEVVHQYSIAMNQQSEGKLQDALQSFLKAAELDPNFARAYSGISSAYGNMGHKTEAEKYAKLAMQHIDRMSERERYRLRGFYYLYNGNWQKCTEEYGELVNRYPSDNIGHTNLATCYSQLRNWPKAIAEAKQDVNLRPDAEGLGNLSLFSSYGGDFAGGEREAHRLQQMMPAFEYSYLSLAFAQIGQEQIEQASDSYKKLDGISPLGASMAAAGLADLDTYEGRFNDAIKILDQAAKNDLAAKSADSAADKFAALAYIQLMKGQRAQAVAMAQKALTCSKARKIRFLAARTFVEGGELDKAQTLATELGSEILAEPQAYGKIIEGQILLKKGNKAEAIKRLVEANNILNTWIGHFDLGRAYVEAGAFAEATSEFDQCITRRGEVLALFLDEVPTFGYLPAVYYYQGRADEGLDAKAATKAYTKFISIQGKGEGGEFLQDANKRLAKLGGK
jgi:tetratricopeptide (TPR) repeat protein/predicted Ser/Thr protein kinase